MFKKNLLLLSTLLLSTGAMAAQFTELSNTNAQECSSLLNGAQRAVVIFQYQGCPFADTMRAEVSNTVDTYASLSGVQLFYFNASYETGAVSNSTSDPCDAPKLSPKEKQYCEVARSCLHMQNPNPDVTGSPTSMIYTNGHMVPGSAISGVPTTWGPENFKNWILS